jgi:hypothetical protein
MAYNPVNDFVATLRNASPNQLGKIPSLDLVIAALDRAGALEVHIGAVAPSSDQHRTLWFKPASPSYASEGQLFAWNPAALVYDPVTPALFSLYLLNASVSALPTSLPPSAGQVWNNGGVFSIS